MKDEMERYVVIRYADMDVSGFGKPPEYVPGEPETVLWVVAENETDAVGRASLPSGYFSVINAEALGRPVRYGLEPK